MEKSEKKSCKVCKYYLCNSHICSNPDADEAATCVSEDHCCHVFKPSKEKENNL